MSCCFVGDGKDSLPPLTREMTYGFLSNTTGFLQKKKKKKKHVTDQLRHSFVVQPLLRKNPGPAPELLHCTIGHVRIYEFSHIANEALW